MTEGPAVRVQAPSHHSAQHLSTPDLVLRTVLGTSRCSLNTGETNTVHSLSCLLLQNPRESLVKYSGWGL